MILPFLEETVVWYGPATVTFPVQFAGDPFDSKRNDVRVRFIGDKNQREERLAYFDPRVGAWRAILYSKQPGSYRAILVRNGSESDTEPEEGIVELKRSEAGLLTAKPMREGRWSLDTGDDWVGLGGSVFPSSTTKEVDAWADAGANWLWLHPQGTEPSAEWDELMAAVERRGLFYTISVPDDASAAWRRYLLARYGGSPWLVQWDAKPKLDDPWGRGASSATPWNTIFENQRGPFYGSTTDIPLLKALKSAIELSDWTRWRSATPYQRGGAEGVADGNRMILKAPAGQKLEGVPLADGTYDWTAFDWSDGRSAAGTVQVANGAVDLKGTEKTFFVLRRRS